MDKNIVIKAIKEGANTKYVKALALVASGNPKATDREVADWLKTNCDYEAKSQHRFTQPFLDRLATAPMDDKEFYTLMDNSSDNVRLHSGKHFNSVRLTANRIWANKASK